jgi:hypothetical protein
MLLPYFLNDCTFWHVSRLCCYGYVAVAGLVLLLQQSDANFCETRYNKHETSINVWNFSFIYISSYTNTEYAADGRSFPK